MARGNNRNRGGLYYDDNFYDPAALIARNRNDDEWYNLGYLLGTAWGANYNQRGTEKATQEGMKILDEAQAKMKQQESTASQNEKAFNAMINDQDNVMGAYKMPSSYAEANGYINELTEQGGEYANVAPKTKGYTDYLQETPKQTLADADYSFRADEVAPKLIAQMRADGRNDYQINAAMKALEPRLLAMDKEAKRGTVQQLSSDIINDKGFINMSDPNTIAKMLKIMEIDPTYAAFLGKHVMTEQDKQLKDLQIAEAQRKLSGKGGSYKLPIESAQYKEWEKRYNTLAGKDELTKDEQEELADIEYNMAMARWQSGMMNRNDERIIRNFQNSSATLTDPNDYDGVKTFISDQVEALKKKNYTDQQAIDSIIKSYGNYPNVIKAIKELYGSNNQQQPLVLTKEEKHRIELQKQQEEERRKKEEEENYGKYSVNRTGAVRETIGDFLSGKKNFGVVQSIRG